jgi:hypothetical protein
LIKEKAFFVCFEKKEAKEISFLRKNSPSLKVDTLPAIFIAGPNGL